MYDDCCERKTIKGSTLDAAKDLEEEESECKECQTHDLQGTGRE